MKKVKDSPPPVTKPFLVKELLSQAVAGGNSLT
jgi:hypothetical protein